MGLPWLAARSVDGDAQRMFPKLCTAVHVLISATRGSLEVSTSVIEQ
jgi:hypothetical protein